MNIDQRHRMLMIELRMRDAFAHLDTIQTQLLAIAQSLNTDMSEELGREALEYTYTLEVDVESGVTIPVSVQWHVWENYPTSPAGSLTPGTAPPFLPWELLATQSLGSVDGSLPYVYTTCMTTKRRVVAVGYQTTDPHNVWDYCAFSAPITLNGHVDLIP